MRVLLTGSRGRLGPSIERRLTEDGCKVTGFDLADGDDILDADAVTQAAAGAHAIVHVAGAAGDRDRPPAEILSLNLTGTSHVLLAAEKNHVGKVIYMSSGRALGLLERDMDYLPLDDRHRGLPSAPYALSKWLAEEMCEAFSRRSSLKTVCLRPVQVFDDEDYQTALSAPQNQQNNRAWALGVHIHVSDVAEAVRLAVRSDIPNHSRVLLSAADIASSRPTLELLAERGPRIPWHGGPEYLADPFRSLIDISQARRILGWKPTRTWPGRAC